MSARGERALALGIASLAIGPLVLVALEALLSGAAPELARAIHGWLAPLCHQDPARCPVVDGHSLGACWRCVGVDVGIAVAALGTARARMPFGALLTLGALDWALSQAGLVADAPFERLVLGAALGAGLAAIVLAHAPALAGRVRPYFARVLAPRAT